MMIITATTLDNLHEFCGGKCVLLLCTCRVVQHGWPASLSFLLWCAFLILCLPLYANTLKPSRFPMQVDQLSLKHFARFVVL